MHGLTGDLVLLGCRTESLEAIFAEYSSRGWDPGSSGSALRTPSCCIEPGRCEWTNYDTLDLTYALTQEFRDEMHRPVFSYKFKIKSSGLGFVTALQLLAVQTCPSSGHGRANILIDQAEVQNYAKKGMDINAEIVNMCPTQCMSYDGRRLNINK